MPGCVTHQGDDRRIQLALLSQAVVQLSQLTPAGKLPEPEQVTGLFEIGVVRELVNVDAAIRENSPIAIDITDFGVGSDDSFESLRSVICGKARHEVSRF
jgi:hypothetical protein